MLADVLTGTVPPIPEAADRLGRVASWELGRNDEFGTCGPTSVANHRRMTTAVLTGAMDAPTIDEVFDLYRRSGNPRFNPDLPWNHPDQEDNGVYMQDMLDALAHDGIGGRKPVAFAKIKANDTDTLNAAVAIFGGVLLGLDLDVAQQRQPVWDYTQGSPNWGGHAVLAGMYRDPAGEAEDRVGMVTWGYRQDGTRAFMNHQEDECWVVIWPEHLSDRTFLDGVDMKALASAYRNLTGRDLPLPEPTPEPAPAPADPERDMVNAVRRLVNNKTAPTYFRKAAKAWLEGK